MKNSGIIKELKEQGYVRRKCRRDPSFNWDKLGSILNGITWTQPDELEEYIIKDENWKMKIMMLCFIIVMILLDFVCMLLEQMMILLKIITYF